MYVRRYSVVAFRALNIKLLPEREKCTVYRDVTTSFICSPLHAFKNLTVFLGKLPLSTSKEKVS